MVGAYVFKNFVNGPWRSLADCYPFVHYVKFYRVIVDIKKFKKELEQITASHGCSL